jgi:hypothetical protein
VTAKSQVRSNDLLAGVSGLSEEPKRLLDVTERVARITTPWACTATQLRHVLMGEAEKLKQLIRTSFETGVGYEHQLVSSLGSRDLFVERAKERWIGSMRGAHPSYVTDR